MGAAFLGAVSAAHPTILEIEERRAGAIKSLCRHLTVRLSLGTSLIESEEVLFSGGDASQRLERFDLSPVLRSARRCRYSRLVRFEQPNEPLAARKPFHKGNQHDLEQEVWADCKEQRKGWWHLHHQPQPRAAGLTES